MGLVGLLEIVILLFISFDDGNSINSFKTCSISKLNDLFSPTYEGYVHRIFDCSIKVRCPFYKRRAVDFIEGLHYLKHMIEHDGKVGLPYMVKRDIFNHQKLGKAKLTGLTMAQICESIYQDWCPSTAHLPGKGYYITGRLNQSIYRYDCIFQGPDPDMPVFGLWKYLLSVSQLFNVKNSKAELIKPLEIDQRTIIAQWRIEGQINLPWKPYVKPWIGKTIYHIDEDGLIARHEETWEIGVLEAFLGILQPSSSSIITSSSTTSFSSSVSSGQSYVQGHYSGADITQPVDKGGNSSSLKDVQEEEEEHS